MKPPKPADAESAALQALAARIGPAQLRHRLAQEGTGEAQLLRQESLLHFLAHGLAKPALLHGLLKLLGLRERARRNTLDIELREREQVLERLPRAFEGLRLLHLSDLHLDVGGGFLQALTERVRGVSHDLCVITGDFRFGTRGPWQPAMQALAALRPHLAPDTFAVLGNHDSIRMLPTIEALGVRVLMNESARVERGGAALWLAGIDDAYYFRAHDLPRAAGAIPPDACALLLSHAPEPYREAAQRGFDLMLCGHTHGGQLCLPGGIPLLTYSSAPRALARGPWRHARMHGYTSVGCGSSLLDVRLNCRPEVTVHRLVRRPAGAGAAPARR